MSIKELGGASYNKEMTTEGRNQDPLNASNKKKPPIGAAAIGGNHVHNHHATGGASINQIVAAPKKTASDFYERLALPVVKKRLESKDLDVHLKSKVTKGQEMMK